MALSSLHWLSLLPGTGDNLQETGGTPILQGGSTIRPIAAGSPEGTRISKQMEAVQNAEPDPICPQGSKGSARGMVCAPGDQCPSQIYSKQEGRLVFTLNSGIGREDMGKVCSYIFVQRLGQASIF